MSCSVGHRCGLGPVLLWLLCKQAATAPIVPLTWEPPCVAGAALEKTKRPRKKNTNSKNKNKNSLVPFLAQCVRNLT